ncbi:MAG: hypothetical protein AAF291_08470 [Pseudomonadota bacterium]
MHIVAILAMCMQTLAPPGHMIALGENGLPTITMCPETHPLLRHVGMEGKTKASAGHQHPASVHGGQSHASNAAQADSDYLQHDHDEHGASVSNDCAFASVTQLATGSVDPRLAVPALVYAQRLELLPARKLGVDRRARLRPPLRAPPSLA